MIAIIRPAVVLLLLFTGLTGIAYPLLIAGLAQAVMPGSAGGSMIRSGGQVVGSTLIGQRFVSDRYFQGRPSAAGEKGYDAAASAGSNLGPLSKKLVERVEGDVAALKKVGALVIPIDAVTASASGLDPHISPTFALLQVERVARVRGVARDRVQGILGATIERPVLGIFGEPRVNVLVLNLALDAAFGNSNG